ncbi:MAG: 50S ribosomal protein L18 [Patescibacteria group bacterium]
MSRQRIHNKLRKIVSGSAERPRLAVNRSLNNLRAQLIDDTTGQTLAAVTSLKMPGSLTSKATLVGQTIAEKAANLKIKRAVYDRGGFAYKGAVKQLAEAARAAGLEI